jgi:chromatin remodeling complex protein RSC6
MNTSTGNSTMSSANKSVVKKVAKKESAPANTVPANTVPAPVAAAPANTVPVAAAKKEKVAKKVASESAPAPVAAVVVPAEPPAASAVATASAANAEPVTTVSQDIEALTTQLQSVRDAAISGLKALSKLSKRVAREVKEAGRRRRRNKAAPVEGAAPVAKRPTIFTTPVTLRDSLCAFLGKPKGSQMTPADVTKAFSTYVESHKLKDAEKGHTIHPDEPMRKVLGVKEGEPLTYRNIQTYLYKLYDLPKRATSASA